jgi:hypothetical protein
VTVIATRGAEQRVADVRRLLSAARTVYARRVELAPAIAASTGLSLEGVDFAFARLEREASDDDLRLLVARAGDAARVHVVLSANVFVAALRAIAVARAAAPRVSIRPSPRDPTLARALVEAAEDPGLTLSTERDAGAIEAGAIHVYGRDETIAAVRGAARPGVVVRGHGAGLGVAVVTPATDLGAAAEALARDVVVFDQRGCLSPRVAFAVGDRARAEAFASALDACLGAWGRRVPRGALGRAERAESRSWRDTFAFAGRVFEGDGHAVGLAGARDAGDGSRLAIGPAGRHLGVFPVPTLDAACRAIAPIARFVVVVGSDDGDVGRTVAPPQARVVPLGAMQSPPLDGPVDLRDH